MFGGLFDLNGDGKTDWLEMGMAAGLFTEMERQDRIQEQIDILESERLSLEMEEPDNIMSDEWDKWNNHIMELDDQTSAFQDQLKY